MTTGHDKSSFIPGGNVQNSHRNKFLGDAEGDNPMLTSNASRAQNVRGDASTKTKRAGVPKIGRTPSSAPSKGSLKKITP
jgi:hypothetical protein